MVVGRSHPTISRHRRAIGTFPNRRTATQALHELRDSSFPMERVSIITRDRDRKGKLADIAQETKADDGAALGAAAGGALGTITGLLVGLGSLAIPGIGPVMLAGATATALATTLAGTAIGAVTGSLLGALVGLGIPEEEAKDYHDRILRGEYLMIVEGTDHEIAQAEYILHRRGIAAYRTYDMPTPEFKTPPPIRTPSVIQQNSVHAQRPIAKPVQQYDTVDIGRSKHGIAAFPNDQVAGGAIAALAQTAFPLAKLSVITRRVEYPEMLVGVDVRDRFETARYGVPVDHAQQYEEQLDRGECLVIVSGGEQELHYGADALAGRGASSWQVYDPMLITPTASSPGSAIAERPQPVVETPPPMAARPAAPLPPDEMQRDVHSQTILPTVEMTQVATAKPMTPVEAPIEATRKIETKNKTVRSKRLVPTVEVVHTETVKPAPPPPPAGVVLPPVPPQPQHCRGLGVSQGGGVETALSALRAEGFPMEQVSLLLKEASSQPGSTTQPPKGGRTRKNAKTSSASSPLNTLLIGMGNLTIPGVGSVIAGGATAMAIAATLVSTSTVGNGTESLVKALMQGGIPENFARLYGDRFHQGDALIMVDGNDTTILWAESILKQHPIHLWDTFSAHAHASLTATPATAPDITPDNRLHEYLESGELEHFGMDQPVQATPAMDGSASPWEEQRDRSSTVKKVIAPMPDVIMIDHRQQTQ